MFDSFPGESFTTFDRSDYHRDFYRVFESGIDALRKLERGQHFAERGFPSWEAFAAGDWERALSLAGEKRDIYAKQVENAKQRGINERRLRVVEFPVTPYVQWEFHVLRLRVEVGGNIRVIDARTIADIERVRAVPEVVILGDQAMYEVRYDAEGNAAGANRFTDPALIAETIAGFETLYARAEPLVAFFEREIVPLPPPAVGSVSIGCGQGCGQGSGQGSGQES